MRIAVVGCGAVGSFYGAKLAAAGNANVHFLLRSDYEAVKANGVRVLDSAGGFATRPGCARLPEEIGPCDLVIVGLKTTANDQFPRLLPPLVNAGTAVLTLQNGLGNEEQLAQIFRSDQILGGLCFVCLNRTAPGVVHHIDHGLVIMGEFSGPAKERTRTLGRLFEHARVSCKVTDDLAKAHWEKLVWNIPFNGLGVAGAAGLYALKTGSVAPQSAIGPCLTTQDILSSAEWTTLARELMNEVIRTAQALGYSIPVEVAEQQIARTRTMGPYKASTLLDFELNRPLELRSLFREPLRQAQQAGVDTPRLRALCAVLEKLELSRGAG